MNDRAITATIQTLTALHIGNGEAGETVDLPAHRDSWGRIYLPGTHIAGRLREIATRLAPALGAVPCVAAGGMSGARKYCDCPVCDLFGHRLLGSEPKGATASRIWVFDAPLTSAPAATTVRDGVGISRRWGSAEDGAKFDIEWIPPRSTFSLCIELEPRVGERSEALLALALSEWLEGRGRIGAGAARGGGAFELLDLSVRSANLERADDLIELLRNGVRPAPMSGELWIRERLADLPGLLGSGSGIALPPAVASRFLKLSFDLAFSGDVLVNDPAAALAAGVDAAPVHAGPGWTDPILPGSSLRGVLRSRMERIARTIATAAATGSSHPVATLARAPGACDPFSRDLTDVLCSCARIEERERDEKREKLTPRCSACLLFGNTQWGSRLWIRDAALKEGTGLAYHLRDFVAIDRFTGGAYGGAKFDALPLRSPTFRAEVLLWNPEPWEVAALVRALLDLHTGRTVVGAKGAAGFGLVSVADLEMVLGSIDEPTPAWVDSLPIPLEAPSGVFTTRVWQRLDLDSLDAALRGEEGPIAEFAKRCRAPLRDFEVTQPRRDSYLASDLRELYPLYDIDGLDGEQIASILAPTEAP